MCPAEGEKKKKERNGLVGVSHHLASLEDPEKEPGGCPDGSLSERHQRPSSSLRAPSQVAPPLRGTGTPGGGGGKSHGESRLPAQRLESGGPPEQTPPRDPLLTGSPEAKAGQAPRPPAHDLAGCSGTPFPGREAL